MIRPSIVDIDGLLWHRTLVLGFLILENIMRISDQLLEWVVSATAQSVAEPFMPRKLSKIGAMEALANYPSAHREDQVEVAKCLLADASSFFQRADVASQITLIGLSVAANRPGPWNRDVCADAT
jgi:hypothetical protein